MKKFIALILAAITVFSFGACKKNASKPLVIDSSWTELPQNTNENFKYFGYYHADGWYSDSYLEDINNTVGCSNICIVDSVARIQPAAQLGYTVMLGVSSVLFQNKVLKPNYQSIWDKFLTEIEPYKDMLYAFYFDEPYLWLDMDDFREGTKYMRETCPEIGVMAVLTAMEFGASNWGNYEEIGGEYYENCTDIGYDLYETWDDERFAQNHDMLKEKIATNGQWIWLVPKSFETEYYFIGNKNMMEHIKGYYTIGISDERCRGIMNFSWASGVEIGDWGYGAGYFFDKHCEEYDEELLNMHKAVGNAIVAMDK